MNLNIQWNFQIFISVPLNGLLRLLEKESEVAITTWLQILKSSKQLL